MTGPSPLLRILNEKVLPRLTESPAQRLVTARDNRQDLVLPPGVRVTPHKRRGKRVAGKDWRPFGNGNLRMESWPDDGQESIRAPLLVFVVSGEADFRLGDYILNCPHGNFLLIPSGTPHGHGKQPFLEGDRREDGYCDLLWFSSRGHTLQCWMSRSRGPVHKSALPGENVQLLDERTNLLLLALNDEALDRHLNCERVCQSLLLPLLLTVQRELQTERFLAINADSRDAEGPIAERDPIDRACGYIRSHLNEPLQIDAVARIACLSRARFTRLFRERMGKTFVEYVSEMRIERACEFLRETDWTVSYISGFVGYKSPSHFHQLFVERMGTSPVVYRNESSRSLQDLSDITAQYPIPQ